MKKHLYWKKTVAPHSFEHCVVHTGNGQIAVTGTVVGEDEVPYHVGYTIQLCPEWKVQSCTVEAQVADKWHHLSLRRCPDGAWFQNGVLLEHTSDCQDIDLSVTPFTNSLPVNRLALEVGQEADVNVLYIDVLGKEVYPSVQTYSRLTETRYLFQSPQDGFEAVVDMGADNFVRCYHGLFEQVTGSAYNREITGSGAAGWILPR